MIWQVSSDRAVYLSPLITLTDARERRARQELIFDELFRDGSLSACVSMPQASNEQQNFPHKNAALIFRYQNPQNYYFAGLGGHCNKFSIYKMIDGILHWLASTGREEFIRYEGSYHINVKCSGNRISLAHNNVVQLEVYDNTFQFGQWGLSSYECLAEFRDINTDLVKPKCFVVMPFGDDFDEVYEVIEETVDKMQYECKRADESFLTGSIMDDVDERIENAEFIIADMTGRNPNVYYEVGYAKALKKTVIQIAQSTDDLAFDVRHIRTFTYTTRILGDRQLAENLHEAIRTNLRSGFTT